MRAAAALALAAGAGAGGKLALWEVDVACGESRELLRPDARGASTSRSAARNCGRKASAGAREGTAPVPRPVRRVVSAQATDLARSGYTTAPSRTYDEPSTALARFFASAEARASSA